ncbi:glycosyltransferase family 2 protein [Suttonella sp. R2A3]|uniref:glycosyltransferase family 2 protein n=1 Tax=Suttonella sp. R2A3 TaxID=2908648 RepID=UPI001F171614|nr:glycosyltransferase family 2 protein [Suttonella sp. R2A3]UJF23665.1 glycosyltransferase family 2 protein [Suttonella sp. R2A3]
MSTPRTVALIPHYRHHSTISDVVAKLRDYGLHCLIVDDGSGAVSQETLTNLATQKGVSVLWREINGGKGAAVCDGLIWANAQGYSHALQVDADGQHHLDDVPRLIKAAETAPQALICARPIYNEDAPKSRLYGRKITNFWIWVNTGSRHIYDGMCGFRVYPLASAIALIQNKYIGKRMDFDTEILVRLHWQGVEMVWIDSRVSYQPEGVSHFRLWRDNALISWMHTRLFFIGLWRRIWR